MSDAVETPTSAETLLDRLGFGIRQSSDSHDVRHRDGLAMVEFDLRLPVMDRLRLMLTGRLQLGVVVIPNQPPEGDARASLIWKISAPFEDAS